MLSITLELAGFAALTAGSYVAGGLAPCLFVGGFCLLFVAQGVDGAHPLRVLKRLRRR